MKDWFEVKSSTNIINFYGRHPEGSGFSIEGNGLLYKMLSGLKGKTDIIPCLRSYDNRNNDVSFSMFHLPTGVTLNYFSISTHRGIWYEYEDIYHECLSAESSCSLEEFQDKLKQLSFLTKDFGAVLRGDISPVPSAERVEDMLEFDRSINKDKDFLE